MHCHHHSHCWHYYWDFSHFFLNFLLNSTSTRSSTSQLCVVTLMSAQAVTAPNYSVHSVTLRPKFWALVPKSPKWDMIIWNEVHLTPSLAQRPSFPSALLVPYKRNLSSLFSLFHPISKWVQHWWCKWVYLFHKNQNVITQPWLFLLCVLWKLRIVQLKSAMNSQLFFFPFDVSYLLLGYM